MTDKYRWHDLLANPEELPDDEITPLVVCCKWHGERFHTMCYYTNSEGFRDGINPPDFFRRSIIAWRYIEPFGGEDQ